MGKKKKNIRVYKKKFDHTKIAKWIFISVIVVLVIIAASKSWGQTKILRPDADGDNYPHGWFTAGDAYTKVDEDPHDGNTTNDKEATGNRVSYSIDDYDLSNSIPIDSVTFCGVFEEDEDNAANYIIPFFAFPPDSGGNIDDAGSNDGTHENYMIWCKMSSGSANGTLRSLHVRVWDTDAAGFELISTILKPSRRNTFIACVPE